MILLQEIVQIASAFSTIVAAAIIIIKPLREKILGIKRIEDGQKCLLRSKMLEIYYKNLKNKKIKQYEYENFMLMYSAYKALGGNSFIDKVKNEIDEWAITFNKDVVK